MSKLHPHQVHIITETLGKMATQIAWDGIVELDGANEFAKKMQTVRESLTKECVAVAELLGPSEEEKSLRSLCENMLVELIEANNQLCQIGVQSEKFDCSRAIRFEVIRRAKQELESAQTAEKESPAA